MLWGGGIWNWLDPDTLVRAMVHVQVTRPEASLFFMGARHPKACLGARAIHLHGAGRRADAEVLDPAGRPARTVPESPETLLTVFSVEAESEVEMEERVRTTAPVAGFTSTRLTVPVPEARA